MKIVPVEPGNRIQLPAEWAELLQLRGVVGLERTKEGILVRVCPPTTWDEVFAEKLPIGRPSPGPEPPLELTGDDYLF